MIQGTLRLTGIISKLYWSRYLVVCLFNSVCLIPLKDIRLVFILNVLWYSLVVYDLRWPHSPLKTIWKGCDYQTGMPWFGDRNLCKLNRIVSPPFTKLGCPGLVNVSAALPPWWRVRFKKIEPWRFNTRRCESNRCRGKKIGIGTKHGNPLHFPT